MKRVPIITNFKQPNQILNLYENDVKLLQFKRVLYRSTCDMFEV